jgi:hypothetical protein
MLSPPPTKKDALRLEDVHDVDRFTTIIECEGGGPMICVFVSMSVRTCLDWRGNDRDDIDRERRVGSPACMGVCTRRSILNGLSKLAVMTKETGEECSCRFTMRAAGPEL